MRLSAVSPSIASPVHGLLPNHRHLLRDMADTGRPLTRWEGGYWTIEDHAEARRREWPAGFRRPNNFVTISVVRELEERGLLRRLGEHEDEWRDTRALTEFGRALGMSLGA